MDGAIARIFAPRSHKKRSTYSQTTPDDEDPPEYTAARDGPPIYPEVDACKEAPSSSKTTADKKDTVGYGEPHDGCDCSPHHGCCREHNSLRSPTESTLVPAHFAMSYHLSFENLACIRCRLGGESEQSRFIPELSWADSGQSIRGVSYDMLSEVFISQGTFLQRQQIRCTFDSFDSKAKGEEFFGCPHRSVKISKPVWNSNSRSSLVEVHLDVTNHPPRCESHSSQRWSNLQGRYAHVAVCTICHSDAELLMKMSDGYLDVTYTCYRDLGAGLDSSDPKWHALVTGEGYKSRPDKELDLYQCVWKLAYYFRRPSMEMVTHYTPSGVVDMSDI